MCRRSGEVSCGEREREREREKRREEKRQDKTRLDERWGGWGPVGVEDGRIVGDWADAGMSG
jgi:hypothetical protein